MRTLEIPNDKITQVEFTKNRLFALTESGHVYVWIIKVDKEDQMYSNESSSDSILNLKRTTPDNSLGIIIPEPIPVTELENIVSIKTGDDHFLALK